MSASCLIFLHVSELDIIQSNSVVMIKSQGTHFGKVSYCSGIINCE